MKISTVIRGGRFNRFDRETMSLEYYCLRNYTNKIKYFILLALCFLTAVTVLGQVTMGSAEVPRAGALLDLKQTNKIGANSTKGLLLPRVILTAENVMLPTGQDNIIGHTGLMVYNIGDENCPFNPLESGVYIWEGDKWLLLNNKGESNTVGVQATIKAGSENVTNGEYTISIGEQLNLKASAEGAKTFTWYLEGSAVAIYQGATLTKTLSNTADFGKYTVVMTDGPECGNEVRAFVDIRQGAPCIANINFAKIDLKNQSNTPMSINTLLGGYDIVGVTSITVTPVMTVGSENEDYYEIRKGSVTGALITSGNGASLKMGSIISTSVGDYYILTKDNCGKVRTDIFQKFTLVECSATVLFNGVELRNQNNVLIPGSSVTKEHEITGVTSIKVKPLMASSSQNDDYYEIRKGSSTGALVASGTIASLTLNGITAASVGEYYIYTRDICGTLRTDAYEKFTLVKHCDTTLKIERLVVTDQNKSYLQYVAGTVNFEAFSGTSSIIVTPIATIGTDVAVRYYLRKGNVTGANLSEGVKTLTTTDIPTVEGTSATYYVVPVDKCGAERPDRAYSFTVERKVCVTPGIGISGPITQQNIDNFKDPSRYVIWDSAAPNAQPAKMVGGAYIIPHNSFRIDTTPGAVPAANAHRFEIHKDDGTILNPNNGQYVGASSRWEYLNISAGPSINGTYTMYMYDTCGNIMAKVTIRLQKG